MLPMSFLYVPGDKPELFTKAADGPADALILDLEDAVPTSRKTTARDAVRTWLQGQTPTSPRGHGNMHAPQLWVRVAAESIQADLDAVFGPALTGIFLAKCTLESLALADEYLSTLETSHGFAPGTVGVIGLIESATALASIEVLAQSSRLRTLALGEVDLMADLRMTRSPHSEPALDSLRTRVVIACAAAQLLPPVAPTSTAIPELDAFAESSRKLHDLGFRSRTAIHPTQIPIIQKVFTPSFQDVTAAQEIVESFRLAQGGLAVDKQGRMIDAAVVRGAQETLQRVVTISSD